MNHPDYRGAVSMRVPLCAAVLLLALVSTAEAGDPSPGVLQAPQGQVKAAPPARSVIQAPKGEIKEDYPVRPQADRGYIQNPAVTNKLREANKAQRNEDQRFLQARDRLREGNVIIDAGSIFVYLR